MHKAFEPRSHVFGLDEDIVVPLHDFDFTQVLEELAGQEKVLARLFESKGE